MKIITRMCTSLDGYVTTPAGWPAQLADPEFSPQSYGFVEFQAHIGAVLMGRTTFEPALGAERWQESLEDADHIFGGAAPLLCDGVHDIDFETDKLLVARFLIILHGRKIAAGADIENAIAHEA